MPAADLERCQRDAQPQAESWAPLTRDAIG
jgi:hypothetical protein